MFDYIRGTLQQCSPTHVTVDDAVGVQVRQRVRTLTQHLHNNTHIQHT